MSVEFESGQAVVHSAEGESFDPTEIPRALEKAGFSAGGEIEVVAVGTVKRGEEFLYLEVEGLEQPFVLAGGEKVDELREAEVKGRIRVTGRLHGSHGDEPPGLTVEGWEGME